MKNGCVTFRKIYFRSILIQISGIYFLFKVNLSCFEQQRSRICNMILKTQHSICTTQDLYKFRLNYNELRNSLTEQLCKKRKLNENIEKTNIYLKRAPKKTGKIKNKMRILLALAYNTTDSEPGVQELGKSWRAHTLPVTLAPFFTKPTFLLFYCTWLFVYFFTVTRRLYLSSESL